MRLLMGDHERQIDGTVYTLIILHDIMKNTDSNRDSSALLTHAQ